MKRSMHNKMKKRFMVIALGVITSFGAFGQIQLTQYFLDGSYFNPSFAGAKSELNANLFVRHQWIGLTDLDGTRVSPQSVVINIHSPLYKYNSGVGLTFINDKTGYENNSNLKLNYNYRFRFRDENKSLALGLSASFLVKSIDFPKLTTELPDDPLIVSQQKSGFIPDADLGLNYQDIDRICLGFSVNNVFSSTSAIGNVDYRYERNYYFSGAYWIGLKKSGRKLYLIPSFLTRTDLKKMQAEVTGRLEYNRKYWAGLSWRYEDAVALLAGLDIKGFRLGASWDFMTGQLSGVAKGSAEIFISYKITVMPKLLIKGRYNTRYL